jgi:hypothetical protein
MTKKPYQKLLILIGLIVSGVFIINCEDNDNNMHPKQSSSQPDPTSEEFSTELSYPDLERLAQQPGGPDVFDDILHLRDVGDAKAVPVLKKILADNIDSTIIHGFAAAQALFCIGTPRAHEILSEYLLTDRYNTSLGINYMFHWEMDESKRNAFIDRYHLQNLSDDLSVNLDAETHHDKEGWRIDFTLTVRNISDKPFRLRNRQVYLGTMLYFRSKNGRYVRSFQTVKYKMPMPKWLELGPGAIQEYNVPVHVRRVNKKLKARYSWLSKDTRLVADTFDTAYDITDAGEFEVYAMVEEQPMSKEQLEQLGLDNTWSGRAVSKPVTVKIGND